MNKYWQLACILVVLLFVWFTSPVYALETPEPGTALQSQALTTGCPSGTTWSITDFGANGNNNQDDYQALLKAAQCASGKQNITINFPAGHYHINEYRIKATTKDGRQPNGVKDIVFNGSANLKLVGAGEDKTLIDVKGDYKMTADYNVWTGKDYQPESHTSTVDPFWFNNCSNVVISGFELNGNFD